MMVGMSASVRSSPLALTVLALLHYKPLHPYGIQRLIRQWGKDQVVNVSQRAGLYRTIERLRAAGLIAVRGAERTQQYPERTVYEITDAGREVAREWTREMIASPKHEFPEFPAALSNLLLFSPEEMIEVLEQREHALDQTVAEHDSALKYEDDQGLPRISMLETEYLRAVAVAEREWVHGVVADLRTDKLTWSREWLAEFAEAQEGPDDAAGGPSAGGPARRHGIGVTAAASSAAEAVPPADAVASRRR